MIFIPVEGESKLISIDVILAKIPRPERSGWSSVIFWSIMIFVLAFPVSSGGNGKVDVKKSLLCTLLPIPWICGARNAEEETNEEVESRYHWIYVFPARLSSSKKGCGCHLDYRYPDDPKMPGWIYSSENHHEKDYIHHDDDFELLACDSSIPHSWPQKDDVWEDRHYIFQSETGEIYDYLYEVRLHCVGKENEKISETDDKVPKI